MVPPEDCRGNLATLSIALLHEENSNDTREVCSYKIPGKLMQMLGGKTSSGNV